VGEFPLTVWVWV